MRFGARALISGVAPGGGGIENGHGLKSPLGSELARGFGKGLCVQVDVAFGGGWGY
jgi:hypothetical protein